MASLLPAVIQMIMSDIVYPADLRPIHLIIKTTEFVNPQMAEIILRSMALLQESGELTSFNPGDEQMIEWFEWTQTATEDCNTYNRPAGYTYNNAEAGVVYSLDNNAPAQAAQHVAPNYPYDASLGASNERRNVHNTSMTSQSDTELLNESTLQSGEKTADTSSSDPLISHQDLQALLEEVDPTSSGSLIAANAVTQSSSMLADHATVHAATPPNAIAYGTPMSSYNSRFSSTPNTSVDSGNLELQQPSAWETLPSNNGNANIWPDPNMVAYRAYAHESHISALSTILCGSTSILIHVETFIDLLALKVGKCTGRSVKQANISVEFGNAMREDGVNASSLLMDDNLVENMIRPLQKKIMGLLELIGEHLRAAAEVGPDNIELASTRLAVGMIGPRPPNADRVREMTSLVSSCVELDIIRRKNPQTAPKPPATKPRGKPKVAKSTGPSETALDSEKPKAKRTPRKRAPKNAGPDNDGSKPTPAKAITEARKAGRGARRTASASVTTGDDNAEPGDEHVDKRARVE